MKLSVVIPTHGRRALVERTLRSLDRQREAPAVEIVVVDDGADPELGEYVRSLGLECESRVIHHDRSRGRAATRNSGIAQATGDVVVFLDADCIPFRNLVRMYRRHAVRDEFLTGAVAYYQDFVKASKKFRLPVGKEREALQDLADTLGKLPEESTAEFIQNEVYEAGKRHFAQAELRQWFKTLYEVLLGSEQGPRMGAFIKLYGRDNVVKLIERALAGEDLSRAA